MEERMWITMAAFRSTPRLAKTRPPCAPLENVIIGFKCQMARAAITQGSETMCEAGRVRVNRF